MPGFGATETPLTSEQLIYSKMQSAPNLYNITYCVD